MNKNYDYIIVGAGSAGCAVANRLSENSENRVLLIEAGRASHPVTRLPASFALLIDNPLANWRYRSEPEESTGNRAIPIPRGKLLGGSSAINGLVYVRGNKLDYDTWAQMGNTGWSYDDVLPFFKKIENYQGELTEVRGGDGPLKVSEVTDRNPIYDGLFKSAEANDIPVNKDYNGDDQEGMSYTQTTIYKGERMSAKVAYLSPIKSRKNLTIITNSLVTKLLFNGKQCVGAEVKNKSKLIQFNASKEVVLCGGAINSPQVLELSGIGDRTILEGKGIQLVHELKGVGENLRDHLGPRLVYNITKPGIAYNDKARGVNLIKQVLKYVFKRDGFLTLPSAPVIGFFKTRKELSAPDVQVHFIPYKVVLNNGKRTLGKEPGITCTVNQNLPESKGSIHIKSSNPEEYPSIKYNFLSSQLDRDTLIAGVKLIRKLMQSESMKEFCDDEIQPGYEFSSDEQILEFIKNKAETLYHPSGTCKMGFDQNAVVDKNLKVHGIKGLRIADASIMPTLVSGNTNAVCMMIGERCADFIINS
ncbi:GMC family oxidoreductase N-terminal domain-containing protein [Alphaproteobacteria bacterium]|nr:GMC family oxidoreductase N-terminal domain-containing protein [Alphaproteobacteria bacterium]